MMTSFSFIAGVLPLVFASGAGSEVRNVMGVTVMFGMLGWSSGEAVAQTSDIQSIHQVEQDLADAPRIADHPAGRILADGHGEVEAGAEAARAQFPDLANLVWQAAETLRETTDWLVAQDMGERFAGSMAYLMAFARLLGAHFHLSAAMAAGEGPRVALASFYIRRMLPQHAALCAQVREGAEGLFDLSYDDLAA